MSKTKELTLTSVFTTLLAASAFIRLPLFFTTITLQFPVVMLCASVLGSRLSRKCVLIYILLGLIGLPIFAEGGGPSYILKPTFGYILGFYPCAIIIGTLGKNTIKSIIAANLCGLAALYLIGTIYFSFISKLLWEHSFDLKTIICACVLIPLPKDLLLCALVAPLAIRLKSFLKH